jgi:hypothetical protein
MANETNDGRAKSLRQFGSPFGQTCQSRLPRP